MILKTIEISCILAFVFQCIGFSSGLLYPRDSESRESKSLDGVWRFRLCPTLDSDKGFREEWFENGIDFQVSDLSDIMPMPVPSSYNDISTSAAVRDHVGWAWYERDFYVPQGWKNDNLEVRLRFGSVHYIANVWVNGLPVGNHVGGHLPFEMDISTYLDFSQSNTLTVAVNNTLTRQSLPQADFVWHEESDRYPPGYFEVVNRLDFFNYAGIQRPVLLTTVPKDIKIEDITVTTDLSDDLKVASVHVDVLHSVGPLGDESCQCVVELYEKGPKGEKVAELPSCSGVLKFDDPRPWWPYLMTSEEPGYLYTLVVRLSHEEYGQDVYRLPVGIRTVGWTSSNFQINYRDFYFRGFGRHEDSDIRGRGLDLPLVARDFELIKWIGANSFRTSHYPYAEEIMDFADQMGIVVIDESPGAALDIFSEELLANHLSIMKELISRDKNRPSVVMWSIANEPESQNEGAREYFKKVAAYTRELDSTRPITVVTDQDVTVDQAAESVDIISINKYFGWYKDTGHVELITRQMINELEGWRSVHNKPVLVTEYGADSVVGLHSLPSFVFSEEYQNELVENTSNAFNNHTLGVIGEMIWNFADFMTKQEIRRVVGNRKGIFTRDRQPKAVAHTLRKRYLELALQVSIP